MTATITPPALSRGDTIAFVSPSARLNDVFPLRITRAKDFLIAQGYDVRIISNEPVPKGYLAGVNHRVAELHAAFVDPTIRAIVCTIGGNSANELVPHLDYELIASNPKIFVGYSDITLLHHALLFRASLRTFYGPAAITQLGEVGGPLDFTWSHFLSVLQNHPGSRPGALPRSKTWTQDFRDWFDETPTSAEPRTLQPNRRSWTWLRKGQAQGRLLGGCLPSLVQLTGTPFTFPAAEWKGRILLLELPEGGDAPATPHPLAYARSNLIDLANAGILAAIAGVVVGRPYSYTKEMWDAWEDTLMEVFEVYGMPVLANVDFGHTDPILTLPLDAMVRLDSAVDVFEVLEPTVSSRKDVE
ncbi:peptidase family S66 [Geranomyces variabilis]|nr:peptidase family S66 [Geranomyces variabilis]KAJ3136310.1 hypothetical protein HDU90_003362 [Geranomyces variabilis]